MVRYLALNFSEMRQVKVSGVQGANFGDRVMPLFDVQLRWNERWDWWAKTDTDAGNVAAKDAIIPMINVMMAGVSGCGNRADLERRKLNDFAVLQRFNAICRHSRNAPQSFSISSPKMRLAEAMSFPDQASAEDRADARKPWRRALQNARPRPHDRNGCD